MVGPASQSADNYSNIHLSTPVVYHDELTDAFLRTLCKLMSIGREKTALIALEKRFDNQPILLHIKITDCFSHILQICLYTS